MSDNDIGQRVKKIVVEHLGVDDAKVTDEASFIDDLGADSLDTVELVMAFEEEFGCEIPDDAAEKIAAIMGRRPLRGPASFLKQRYAPSPERNNDVVEQTLYCAELHDQAGHDDERHEVRQIRHALDDPFVRGGPHLIQHEGEYDRCRESHDESGETDHNRVPQDSPEIRRGEELLKIRETNPWTLEDPARRAVPLERNNVPEQRNVVEDHEVDEKGQEHEIENAIVGNSSHAA